MPTISSNVKGGTIKESNISADMIKVGGIVGMSPEPMCSSFLLMPLLLNVNHLIQILAKQG